MELTQKELDDRTLQVRAKNLFGNPLGTNLVEGIEIGAERLFCF
jgi:hypothetical protein